MKGRFATRETGAAQACKRHNAPMSVFTPLNDDQISAVLAGAGRQLVSAKPAEHGMENSNFLLRARTPDGDPAD